MGEIWERYVGNLWGIWERYGRDMGEICGKFVGDLGEIWERYVGNLWGICGRDLWEGSAKPVANLLQVR